MIGLALAFVVLGLALLFVVPWVGIPVGIAGVLLAVVYAMGFGRRAATRSGP
jgi:hypothetical protein